MNLEEEFQRLMQEVIANINSKVESGKYDKWNAQDLIQMVENILDHGDTSRYSNACPHGHQHDCGWSSSMGYHCS
jgi:hypothetical protein